MFVTLLTASAWAAPFAVFNYKIFYVPGKGPIVETYFDFQGRSVILKEDENGTLKGQIEILLIFKNAGEIITFDKKIIETPEMTAESMVDFLDIQRFALPSGQYALEIQLSDVNDETGSMIKSEQIIEVPDMSGDMFFSDIQLVSAYKKSTEPGPYTKSGFDLLPMVSDDHASPQMSEIVVYTEFYGAAAHENEEMFLLTSYLENIKTGEPLEETRKYERRKTAEVSPFLTRIDIENVRSGDYNIVVEARNKENELLNRQSHMITRNKATKIKNFNEIDKETVASSWVNQYDSKAEMAEHIRSLSPIAGDADLFAMDNTFSNTETHELSYLQQYFYAFWENRDPDNSQRAWLEYKEKVDYVDLKFGTRNKKGYETDRGRVYLRYGPPNDLTDRANEPSSYPYQIWRYYKADRWNNVKFIFYDPTLIGQDYELLHCEYIPGEIRNPQWQLLLEQRNTPMNNVDRREGRDHFGGRVDQLFENPR